MNKKVLMLTTVAILALLTSSVIAVSQAWWFRKPKPEFVGYDFEAIFGPNIFTLFDGSGGPSRLVIEGHAGSETVIECNVTINGKVYSYPDDFNYNHTFHLEFNAITGKGFMRVESTLTFNLPWHPTLTDRLVSRATGLLMAPNGTLLTPEDIRYEGEFELTGTRMFNKVEGFGLEEGYYLPPNYETQYARHFGFIKGCPLR